MCLNPPIFYTQLETLSLYPSNNIVDRHEVISISCCWPDGPCCSGIRSLYNPQSALHYLYSSRADDNLDIFEIFTHGGVQYPVYQYIRENTNYNSPIIDLVCRISKSNFHIWCNFMSFSSLYTDHEIVHRLPTI